MKKTILSFSIILILLVFISGCAEERSASEGSGEMEQQVQAPPAEQPITKIEIKVSQKGMEMIIAPSQDNSVKDIVTITVTKAPTNTGVIGFAIEGPGVADIRQTGPNLGYDSDGSDGWSFEFDTNSYPNNKYTIATIAFPVDRQSGEPPLGAAQAQVESQEFCPVYDWESDRSVA